MSMLILSFYLDTLGKMTEPMGKQLAPFERHDAAHPGALLFLYAYYMTN